MQKKGSLSRRNFLQLSLGAAGGLLLAGSPLKRLSAQGFQGAADFWDWEYEPRQAYMQQLITEWQEANPGVTLNYTTFPYNIRGNVWALNNAATTRVFQGVMTYFFVPIIPSQDVNIIATSPWDNAPGGWRNTMADMDSVPVPYGDLIALYPHHCFIPSVSALALNTTDPFFNIAGAGNLYSLTPFDSLFFPAMNEDHVEVNAGNLYFILNELVDSLPAPVVTAYSNGATVDLHWTRVPAARSYQVFSSDDPEVWLNAPVVVTDTLWSEPLAPEPKRFYKIVASLNP